MSSYFNMQRINSSLAPLKLISDWQKNNFSVSIKAPKGKISATRIGL